MRIIKKRFCFFLLILLVALGTSVRAEEIALPSAISIINPSQDVPTDIARFSGVWTDGAWDGILFQRRRQLRSL